jgi:futalosine hydrolase
MKTLVVAATTAELSGIFEHFNLEPASFVQGPGFDILITGVGMTATAFALGKTLNNTYTQLLNLGIAGAFDREIPLGALVYIHKETFSELGAQDKEAFLTIDELGFGSSTIECMPVNHRLLSGLAKGSGITVNTVHGHTESIRKIAMRLSPTIESMEGAAVFYAAQQTGTPCIQVRSISNYVEERNKAAWKIGLAIKNLNDWGISFLTNL